MASDKLTRVTKLGKSPIGQSLLRISNAGRINSPRMADKKGTLDLALHELNKARGNVRTSNAQYYPIAKKQYNAAKSRYDSLKKYGK